MWVLEKGSTIGQKWKFIGVTIFTKGHYETSQENKYYYNVKKI